MNAYLSHLLTKPVNIFTFVIAVSLAGALAWLGHQRYEDFLTANKLAADNATSMAAAAVETFITDHQRIVQIFLEDNFEDIYALSDDPENWDLYERVNDKLDRFFPDFFSLNIATASGDPIIDDFDGNLGEICVEDMKSFVLNNKRIIRVHPNYNLYHFDVIVKFQADGQDRLFFVSFGLDEISRLLKATQPENHDLLLTLHTNTYLIEVTVGGSRDKIYDRDDYRFTDSETGRIVSSSHVTNTSWDIVDLYHSGLLSSYRNALIVEGSITYGFFLFIVLLLRRYLAKEEHRRNDAEAVLTLRSEEVAKLNSELLSRNKELSEISVTDELTGLYNRRYFDDHLRQEWNRAKRDNSYLTLVMIDVDHFKLFNDSYGHQKGDKCLRTVAEIMFSSFRRADEFVSRYGGEEFAVVIAGNDKQSAYKDVMVYKNKVEEKKIIHSPDCNKPYVTISAGIASVIPSNQETIEGFIEMADIALYKAKEKGRNCVEIGGKR